MHDRVKFASVFVVIVTIFVLMMFTLPKFNQTPREILSYREVLLKRISTDSSNDLSTAGSSGLDTSDSSDGLRLTDSSFSDALSLTESITVDFGKAEVETQADDEFFDTSLRFDIDAETHDDPFDIEATEITEAEEMSDKEWDIVDNFCDKWETSYYSSLKGVKHFQKQNPLNEKHQKQRQRKSEQKQRTCARRLDNLLK